MIEMRCFDTLYTLATICYNYNAIIPLGYVGYPSSKSISVLMNKIELQQAYQS
jgi:hypothetical protein